MVDQRHVLLCCRVRGIGLVEMHYITLNGPAVLRSDSSSGKNSRHQILQQKQPHLLQMRNVQGDYTQAAVQQPKVQVGKQTLRVHGRHSAEEVKVAQMHLASRSLLKRGAQQTNTADLACVAEQTG